MVASISWCRASVDTTMSPISMEASKEPATPVLMICVTWKRSARICTHMAAFTLPTPLRTITTSCRFNVPSWNSMEAFFTICFICIWAFSVSTSSSMAPIIPIFFIFCLFSFLILPCLLRWKFAAKQPAAGWLALLGIYQTAVVDMVKNLI